MEPALKPWPDYYTVPVTVQPEGDNIFRMQIRGLLLKTDLDRGQNMLLADKGPGPVKLLVVLDSFEGWESGAHWHDLSFYARHGDDIERIAIVGAERWRDEAMMFAAADLRRAPVKFFFEHELEAARTWLTA